MVETNRRGKRGKQRGEGDKTERKRLSEGKQTKNAWVEWEKNMEKIKDERKKRGKLQKRW